MMLVITPTGEILETDNQADGTRLTLPEILERLAAETSCLPLYASRKEEIAAEIANLQEKKSQYSNGDAEAIQREIDRWATELDLIPSQEQGCWSRVNLLTYHAQNFVV